ncbi:MAG: HAMP domain-containing histidine kinase [Rubrivivax sp.]|nr:HAMP domain-containing histidine kinase [Rubrivivax sp.]
MSGWLRPSFRQLLVVAFLLLTALLAAVSLRGLSTLERLLQQSRAGAERTLQLSGHIERLGEHHVTMERAARQYLVLGDSALRSTYQRAATAAVGAVDALAGEVALSDLVSAWQTQRAVVDAQLAGQPPPSPAAVTATVAAKGAAPSAASAAATATALATAAATNAAANGPRSAAEKTGNSAGKAPIPAATAPVTAPGRDARLAQAFRELIALHSAMAERVRSSTQAANAALQGELEAGRLTLGRQGLAAIGVALVLALALAIALARPLQRVEAAIVGLGENRLDQRIDIPGPSDVRQIGRRLDWLRQRLSQLEADKARFLRHVSHELKTPLSALREGVALLDDGVAGPLTDNQRQVARILRDNTATLQQRIEDLLRFNAAAFAAQRLVRKPTDVAALVRRLADEQQLQWRARGLQLHLPEAPVMAEVDADLLGSAIGNLLSNAIRYSPHGASIAVHLQRNSDGLRIEVADQGPGVAAADRDRIFEPFYRGQLQPAGGLAGTGIGLSIVAETAAAHGGRARLLPGVSADVLPDDLPAVRSTAPPTASPPHSLRHSLPHSPPHLPSHPPVHPPRHVPDALDPSSAGVLKGPGARFCIELPHALVS